MSSFYSFVYDEKIKSERFYKDLTEKAFALTMSELTTLPSVIKKLGDIKNTLSENSKKFF